MNKKDTRIPHRDRAKGLLRRNEAQQRFVKVVYQYLDILNEKERADFFTDLIAWIAAVFRDDPTYLHKCSDDIEQRIYIHVQRKKLFEEEGIRPL